MPVSSTVSVSYWRSFTGDNPGARWQGPVAIDPEFSTSGMEIFITIAVVRTSTWWIQFTDDLELLPNTLGARNDLVVTFTHPSAGTIVGDISAYQTAASRDGFSQANFTPRDSAARTAWGTAVSDDSDALSITLSSASSGPAAPPTPTVGPGFVLGGKQITKAYLGETEIERVYLGDTLIFGDPAPPPPPPVAKLTLHSDNGHPRGIWSDGTTMWVADLFDNKVYAYTLATGSRVSSKEFDLTSDNANNDNPRGLWSDGTTMWVCDFTDKRVYAYTLATGARDTNKEFSFDASANAAPTGIWSDGTTMWVADLDDDKVYAYTLATGSRVSSKEFDFNSANASPGGLGSDGTTMWVMDLDDDKLYAYTLSNGARDTSKEFDLTSNNDNPRGIWSDGTIMWVSDESDDVIYSYVLATGTLRT